MFERDDLTLQYLGLLIDLGREDEALEIVTTMQFQPFEGGEGKAIAILDRAVLAVARRDGTDPEASIALLEVSAAAPENLGEGRHPAVSVAEREVVLGDLLRRVDRADEATAAWERAVAGPGALAVDLPIGPEHYWVGVALTRLGRSATAVWDELDAAAAALEAEKPRVDYFATSLPELLLFDTDTDARWLDRIAELRSLAAQGRALVATEARA